jgi:predicted transcriptional regulator
MVTTHVQLSEPQIQALERLAAAQNKSSAELIRQVVDDFLRSAGSTSLEERKRRAIAAAGRFSSDVTDLATEHDQYLAEAY